MRTLTSIPGITWPILPNPENAQVLSLLQQMEHSQWWTIDQIEERQMRQLTILLTHCRRHIPFYRRKFQVLENKLGSRLTLDDFRQIPLLHRSELQEIGDQLISPVLPKHHSPRDTGKTSGSTGRSITYQYCRVTGLFYRALNLRAHLWHHKDFTKKLAAIRNPRLITDGENTGSAPNWQTIYQSGSFVELSVQTPVSEQIQWLVQEQPDYLLTYPSNLLALVRYTEKNQIKLPEFMGIDTISEICTDEVRYETERIWNIKPIDMYSCMENGVLALECPENDCYHVQSENIMLEILDVNDHPCKPGEVGRVVITDLHNFAMPFIRYAIGDYAEMGEPCSCGRGLPVMKRILGRTRNMVVLPDGDQMWPILPISKWSQMGPIRQIQVIQKSRKEMEVRLAVSEPMSRHSEGAVREAVDEFFQHRFTVSLTTCDEIPRSKSGKFEDFMSLIL